MKKEDTEKRLFFRYQKIDNHLKDNLKKHVLYFSNPLKFNDPFDSKFDVIYKGTWKCSTHREHFHLRNEGSIHREHF